MQDNDFDDNGLPDTSTGNIGGLKFVSELYNFLLLKMGIAIIYIHCTIHFII